MAEVTTAARRAADSPTMSAMARFGLAARAFVYLVIGWLGIEIARGRSTHEANQKGALAEIAQHSYGIVLLWILGIGFASYAIWRLSEAAFGTAAEGHDTGPRLKSLVRGVVYAGLAVTTFTFIAGRSGQGQSQQQETMTARLMRHGYGRWLVGIVGVVVVGVGLGMIFEGVSRRFERQFRMQELTGTVRSVVVWLGVVGTAARGIAFGIAGVLVVEAAVTFDPAKSTGLDGALRTLAHRPYGPWLLGILAGGLIAFGIYGLAAARWAKT